MFSIWSVMMDRRPSRAVGGRKRKCQLMAEQLQCKHKHKHVRRNNEGGCHETSHEICEFRIHSSGLEQIKVALLYQAVNIFTKTFRSNIFTFLITFLSYTLYCFNKVGIALMRAGLHYIYARFFHWQAQGITSWISLCHSS